MIALILFSFWKIACLQICLISFRWWSESCCKGAECIFCLSSGCEAFWNRLPGKGSSGGHHLPAAHLRNRSLDPLPFTALPMSPPWTHALQPPPKTDKDHLWLWHDGSNRFYLVWSHWDLQSQPCASLHVSSLLCCTWVDTHKPPPSTSPSPPLITSTLWEGDSRWTSLFTEELIHFSVWFQIETTEEAAFTHVILFSVERQELRWLQDDAWTGFTKMDPISFINTHTHSFAWVPLPCVVSN